MLASLVLVIVSISLAVCGQVSLKVGMNKIGQISAAHLNRLGEILPSVLFNPNVIYGLLLYFVAALIWLVVLSRVDLSFAYPMMGLSYVIILIISSVALGENVTLQRWLGAFIICTGVFLIART